MVGGIVAVVLGDDEGLEGACGLAIGEQERSNAPGTGVVGSNGADISTALLFVCCGGVVEGSECLDISGKSKEKAHAKDSHSLLGVGDTESLHTAIALNLKELVGNKGIIALRVGIVEAQVAGVGIGEVACFGNLFFGTGHGFDLGESTLECLSGMVERQDVFGCNSPSGYGSHRQKGR